MFRTLAIAAALSVAVARAAPVVTQRSGVWENLEGTDNGSHPICAMGVEGDDRWILIKYTVGEPYLTFTLGKSGWNVVPHAKIKVELQVDSLDPWIATATATDRRDILFTIQAKQIAQFLTEVSDGANMRISFVEERENDWRASLDGSDDIARSFGNCVSRITHGNQGDYE